MKPRKPFDFARAPRSFMLQLDPRTERIVRNIGDQALVGAIWGVAGCDAGMHGYASTPHHRKGCDMAKTAESLLVALARTQALVARTAAMVAKIRAQDDALRREEWEANAPIRTTATALLAHLRGGE